MDREYDTSMYFEFFDEKGFIGAVAKKNADLISYHNGLAFLDALLFVKNILNNANVNLFSKKDKIPREIYALRLLEGLPVEGDEFSNVPIRTVTTAFLLEPFEEEYNIDNIIDERFVLTLDYDEARNMDREHKLRVYINLETKSMMLDDFLTAVDEGTYCKIKLYNPLKIKKFKETLATKPVYLTDFNFNLLDDVASFIEKNVCGFKSIVGASIYLAK